MSLPQHYTEDISYTYEHEDVSTSTDELPATLTLEEIEAAKKQLQLDKEPF